jgi:cytochrome c-type biogenesis protein
MTTVKRAFSIIFISLILSLFMAFNTIGDGFNEDSVDQTTELDDIDGTLAVPDNYVHRPIMELFTGLGCTYCQNGPDQAADRLFHEALDDPSQPHHVVVFHQNNGAGDDDLTIPESQERYDDYFVSGTPNAQFDGGFRQVSGGEDGEEANYQTYSQAMADSYIRYEDNTLNPFDNNFKFVNLQIFQEFSGDGYRVSVKVEYLGSASDRPSLGILPINSPDLSGSLHVFMTEDNVTAWSSERNGGEYVINNAAFRGNAIRDEQFILARGETFEIMAEWEFPEDPVIPIKPGDFTAVAVVYDLDDTSSGRSDGGNPANVPRAIQSATPRSTAYDLGNDIPTADIDFTYNGEAQISAKFEDENGISKAYVLYNTEGTNSTNWEYSEMEISGEELCDEETGACYAYTDSEGIASIPMKEGEILYYQLLIYDGNGTEGKTELLTYTAAGSLGGAGGGSIALSLVILALGIIVLGFGFLYMLNERRKEAQLGSQGGFAEVSVLDGENTPSSPLPSKKASKTVMLSVFILGMMLVSVGAVASVLPSGDSEVVDFEMVDVDGNEFSLSDFRGKVVYLEFMATWCSDCKKLTKELKDVYAEFGNDIVMISLDIDKKETPEQLKTYANENGAKWIFAFPKDFDMVVETFSIHEIPKSFVIDKNGDLTHEFVLSQPSDEIIDKIASTKSGMASPISMNSMPIILIAFAAGIASFFSPCAFPMLPGYVGYYLGIEEHKKQEEKKMLLKKALFTGTAAALGILLIYLFIGFLIMLIGPSIYPFIPFFTPLVAIIIIVLGLLMLSKVQYYFITNRINKLIVYFFLSLHLDKWDPAKKIQEKELGGIFTYGIGYGFAAAGCTLPLLMLIIPTAISSGGFFSGMLMFLVFGLGAAIFMVAVTLLVATSKDSIINKMKMSTGKIKMISGIFMVIAGIALLAGFYITFMT